MTKIIRIVNGPLMNQAIEAISKVDQTDISSSDGSYIHMLSGVFQQMIRWHCRLNHVSAHTFIYNVHLDYKNLIDLTSVLVRFIVSDVGKSFSEDFRHIDQMKQVDAYVTTAIKRWSHHHYSSISGSLLSEHVMQRLEQILMKELNDTKNLTNWPCMGFWDVQDIDSPVVKGIATELVPDCKAQYTKCSVKKDLCEEKGDKDCFE